MFAVVKHNGNQYKVESGKEYEIDLLPTENEDGKEIEFNEVLLVSDDKKIEVGTPFVKGAVVKAENIGTTRGDKIRVFKFEAKKRYKRTLGHKQSYTKIKVLEIRHEK